MSGSVIAPIDLGPMSLRVLHHAAGFARLLQADLRIVHITTGTSPEERGRVIEFCTRVAPYQFNVDDAQVVVRPGKVSETICREAARDQASLIVVGARSHGGVAKFLLGSSSEAVLRRTSAPVLLVPPNDIEIVSLADRAALTSGPILAAVDLSETSERQLMLAGRLAGIGRQPLLLATIAPPRLSDFQAVTMLNERAEAIGVRPAATIVRRGDVAAELSCCALTEGAGLVVMGLRARGRPGAIATAVLKANRAFVLAVPGR
jgi:nucleotide-binding universal stress UspA family protein